MKIALVSGNPHLPQLRGGLEVNTHELAHELSVLGHEVFVVAMLGRRGSFGVLRRLRGVATRRAVQVDSGLGYRVYRSRRPWERVPQLPRVDVALIQNARMLDFGRAFRALGIPAVAYFHGLPFDDWKDTDGRGLCPLPFDGYVAVSEFVARRFQGSHGLDAAVVPPLFRSERYRTEVVGRAVTLINPVPEKGVELALEIAALCPEVPFQFVLGWPLPLQQRAALQASVWARRNVRLRTSARDMMRVYRDTRILLAPSQWEAETWGRVASEAQFSGIPVIASNRGGLPEAVGNGGTIIGYDQPAAVWAKVVREVWHDEDRYRQLSAEALRHAQRPSLDPRVQADALVRTLQGYVSASDLTR